MEEGKQDPPVLPVGSGEVDPGISIRVNEEWQVSSMPEEKQYFSLDVSYHAKIHNSQKVDCG